MSDHDHPELACLGVPVPPVGDWLIDWASWAVLAIAGALCIGALAAIVIVLAGCDAPPAARPMDCVPAAKVARPVNTNV